jgi:hypothetical protein
MIFDWRSLTSWVVPEFIVSIGFSVFSSRFSKEFGSVTLMGLPPMKILKFKLSVNWDNLKLHV